MKELKIKIIEWKDITKWFWDKFCFPRRELVADWLDYHNDGLTHITEEIILKYGGEDAEKSIAKAMNEWRSERDELTKRTKELIMMK